MGILTFNRKKNLIYPYYKGGILPGQEKSGRRTQGCRDERSAGQSGTQKAVCIAAYPLSGEA